MIVRTSLFLPTVLVLLASSVRAQTETDTAAIMDAFSKMFDPSGVEVKPSYTFQHSVDYTTKEDKWGSTEKEEMELFFNPGSAQIAIRQETDEEGRHVEMFLVFDLDTRTTVTFVHSDTMNLCMPMRLPDFGEGEPPKTTHFKATGKSRTIAGMKANEWVSNDDEEVHLGSRTRMPVIYPACSRPSANCTASRPSCMETMLQALCSQALSSGRTRTSRSTSSRRWK
jgi:hypothetical protein